MIDISNPRDLGFLPDRLDRIPAFIKAKYLDTGLLPHAALLVARADEVVHLSVQGDARPGQALKQDSLFRIASMTKPITSIVFMQLVEECKVALAHSVASYLPEFAETGVFVQGGGNAPFLTRRPAVAMTMLDLLRHTSGLTYSFQERTPVDAAYRKTKIDDFQSALSLEDFTKELAKLPLEFDPGSSWNYSISTDVLGAVIQKIEGKPLGQVFKERIFDPLGMVDTFFVVPEEKTDRLTDAYVVHPTEKLKLVDSGAKSGWSNPARMESGGGGLVSSISDYHRFCRMLTAGGALDDVQIISPKTLELMTANHLPGGADLTEISKSAFSEADNAGIGFGLGFACNMNPAKTLVPGTVGEFYWGGMFSTAFNIDPVEQVHFVFMTQLMPSSTYPIRRELRTMINAALAA